MRVRVSVSVRVRVRVRARARARARLGAPQVVRRLHHEGGEAEVEGDATLLGLRMLVEGGGGSDGAAMAGLDSTSSK